MTDQKYTEEEILWAIEELKNKHPERATREQAVKLLDTMKDFVSIPVSKLKKDKESGIIPNKELN